MRRILSAVATLAVTALAAPASATTCPLVTDVAGDGQWRTVRVVESDQLDILSADAAVGATTLVAVLRVADLDPDTVSTLGVEWRFGWDADGVRYGLEARRGPGGHVNVEFTAGSTPVPVTAAFDHTAETITWTAARSDVPGLSTGTTFDAFAATTAVLGSSADAAWDPTSTYVVGDPTCVTAA